MRIESLSHRRQPEGELTSKTTISQKALVLALKTKKSLKRAKDENVPLPVAIRGSKTL